MAFSKVTKLSLTMAGLRFPHFFKNWWYSTTYDKQFGSGRFLGDWMFWYFLKNHWYFESHTTQLDDGRPELSVSVQSSKVFTKPRKAVSRSPISIFCRLKKQKLTESCFDDGLPQCPMIVQTKLKGILKGHEMQFDDGRHQVSIICTVSMHCKSYEKQLDDGRPQVAGTFGNSITCEWLRAAVRRWATSRVRDWTAHLIFSSRRGSDLNMRIACRPSYGFFKGYETQFNDGWP